MLETITLLCLYEVTTGAIPSVPQPSLASALIFYKD